MQCPTCRKVIPDGSAHCAYCGAATRPLPVRKAGGWPFWSVVLVALGMLGGGWLLGSAQPTPAPQVIERVVTQLVYDEAVVETVVVTATPEGGLTAGAVRVWEPDSMTAVYVPAGEFLMGAAADDPNVTADEIPQHTVVLDGFWVDFTEVTSAQYQLCVDAGNCAAANCASAGPGNPAVCVTWQSAVDYCAWAGRRLPTEAEWEKAARGTDGRQYPWGNDAPTGTILNLCDRNCTVDWKDEAVDDGYVETAPVGSFVGNASPYGALDMAGNAREWVADWYGADYYQNSPAYNPTGPDSGETRIMRGGSWYNTLRDARTTIRVSEAPENSYTNVGFRCVRSE